MHLAFAQIPRGCYSRIMKALLIGAIMTASAAALSAQAADRSLQLQFHEDGTVSLAAQHVTPGDILQAWATKCECFVVNGNRLTGPVIATPILFERAPQAAVLRSLLRQAGGYVLTPRRADARGPSQDQTIYILPTSAAVSSPVLTVANPIPFQPVQNPTAGAPDDEIPPVLPIRIPESIDPERGQTPPAQPTAPTPSASPSGVSIPGVRVVPISPVSPSPSPGTSPPAPSPGTAPTAPSPAPHPQRPVGSRRFTPGRNP